MADLSYRNIYTNGFNDSNGQGDQTQISKRRNFGAKKEDIEATMRTMLNIPIKLEKPY